MALYVRQNEQKSELEQRIGVELREKLKAQAAKHDTPEPAILDNQHETRIAGKVILVLIALLVIALIIFALRAGGLI